MTSFGSITTYCRVHVSILIHKLNKLVSPSVSSILTVLITIPHVPCLYYIDKPLKIMFLNLMLLLLGRLNLSYKLRHW